MAVDFLICQFFKKVSGSFESSKIRESPGWNELRCDRCILVLLTVCRSTVLGTVPGPVLGKFLFEQMFFSGSSGTYFLSYRHMTRP